MYSCVMLFVVQYLVELFMKLRTMRNVNRLLFTAKILVCCSAKLRIKVSLASVARTVILMLLLIKQCLGT